MTAATRHPKIRPDHLRRQAVVYIRQSSAHQVRGNRESSARQYALVERANRLAEALERLRGGDYGTCEECEEPIAPARLRAMPEVRTCVRCQDRLERMSRHLQTVGAGLDGEEAEEE